MPKIDVSTLPWRSGTSYPKAFHDGSEGRARRVLGRAAGLSQFGVNLTRLEPGATSAQRHWHEAEDEFVYVIEGELVLVEDDGETILGVGEAAGFKAGVANGHHLINRSDATALYLEIGTRAARERGHYPDIDLAYERDEKGVRFTHKDGSPYES